MNSREYAQPYPTPSVKLCRGDILCRPPWKGGSLVR